MESSPVSRNLKPPHQIPDAFSKCSKCDKRYNIQASGADSLLLVCLHSFCRECINKGYLEPNKDDKQNLVTCTRCKCNSNKADCGRNLLADTGPKITEYLSNPPLCSCEGKTLCTALCRECNEPLCGECVSAHKRVSLTKNHQIVTLKELRETQPTKGLQYSCTKHSYDDSATEQLQLDRFCEKCSKVTCVLCHEGGSEHHNHPYLFLDSAAHQFKNNLAGQLQNLRDKKLTVNHALGVVNEKMADVDEAESQALTEVKEYYNTVMEALRSRLNDLGSEIRKFSTQKREKLKQTRDDVKHLQSRLSETINAVGYVAEKGDSIAVLSVNKGLKHHMATLLKLKCQVPNPSHKLNIKLQTNPALLNKIIPQTGEILIDGAVYNNNSHHMQNGAVTQAPSSYAHVQQPGVSLKTRKPSGLNPPYADDGSQPTHHRRKPSVSRKVDQSNYGTAMTGGPNQGSRIPNPSLISMLPTANPRTQRHRSLDQPVFPATNGAELLTERVKSNFSIGNGNNNQGEHQKVNPIRISKVPSDSDHSNGSSFKVHALNSSDESRETTPPLPGLAKRKKHLILSPRHTSSNHRPGDPNEDYCAVCHNGGEMICCDTCPKVYHALCHVPDLSGTPSAFSCTLCWDESEPEDSESNPLLFGVKRKAPSGLTDYEVHICEKILLQLFCHPRSLAFHLPVPKTVKHYTQFIKKPMDLTTIKSKLRRQHFNHYDSIQDFVADVRLIFSNCNAFNGAMSDYTESARQLQSLFVKLISFHFPSFAEMAGEWLPAEKVMNLSVKNRLLPQGTVPVSTVIPPTMERRPSAEQVSHGLPPNS